MIGAIIFSFNSISSQFRSKTVILKSDSSEQLALQINNDADRKLFFRRVVVC